VAFFRAHLDGVSGLGISPIDSNDKVTWCAEDIDVYPLDHAAFLTKIAESGLQLNLFRSKSNGGPRLSIFQQAGHRQGCASEDGRGRGSVERKAEGRLPEVRPAQGNDGNPILASDGKHNSIGNWINLPYFGITQRTLLELDANGKVVDVPFKQMFGKVKLMEAAALDSKAANDNDEAGEKELSYEQELRQQALDLNTIEELVAFLPPPNWGDGNIRLYAAAFAAGVMRRDDRITSIDDAEDPLIETAIRRGTPDSEARATFRKGYNTGLNSHARRGKFFVNAKGTWDPMRTDMT
jgi:hypothetical protein